MTTSKTQKVNLWGEEGKKLFIFQRKSYRNSSLALDVVKPPFALILIAKKAVTPLHNAAAAV